MQKTKKFFAASNSGDGFKSYYDSVFSLDKLSKLYIIKGGPGTGKSYFMKRASEIAEGKGYHVDHIYCSSDANSLDGIIIHELSLAMLDGTAPHAYDAKLPGAVEEIVDLGAFWKPSLLAGSRKTIECLSRKKSACFARAYSYLASVKNISESIENLVSPFVRYDKMKKFVCRMFENIPCGGGRIEYALVNSIGMEGSCSFDTYFESSDIYFAIHDIYETGHLLLNEIFCELQKKCADAVLSPNPILPKRLDSLLIPDSKTAFEINDRDRDGIRTVNMKRFVNVSEMGETKSDIRLATRIRDNVKELALHELDKAKKYHFTLEEIYGSAMDFSAKEQFSEDFFRKSIK